jgi:DNA-binding MarR family transcriptional regulator
MPSETHDLGVLLGTVYQQFLAKLQDHLEKEGFAGIGPSNGNVFRALLDKSLTTSQLAAQLRITPQGAAGIVRDMERGGYVEGRPDPSDGRLKRLYLTERGRAAIGEVRRFHREYERRLAKRNGAKQVKAMRAVLTATVEAIPGAAEGGQRVFRLL